LPAGGPARGRAFWLVFARQGTTRLKRYHSGGPGNRKRGRGPRIFGGGKTFSMGAPGAGMAGPAPPPEGRFPGNPGRGPTRGIQASCPRGASFRKRRGGAVGGETVPSHGFFPRRHRGELFFITRMPGAMASERGGPGPGGAPFHGRCETPGARTSARRGGTLLEKHPACPPRRAANLPPHGRFASGGPKTKGRLRFLGQVSNLDWRGRRPPAPRVGRPLPNSNRGNNGDGRGAGEVCGKVCW